MPKTFILKTIFNLNILSGSNFFRLKPNSITTKQSYTNVTKLEFTISNLVSVPFFIALLSLLYIFVKRYLLVKLILTSRVILNMSPVRRTKKKVSPDCNSRHVERRSRQKSMRNVANAMSDEIERKPPLELLSAVLVVGFAAGR